MALSKWVSLGEDAVNYLKENCNAFASRLHPDDVTDFLEEHFPPEYVSHLRKEGRRGDKMEFILSVLTSRGANECKSFIKFLNDRGYQQSLEDTASSSTTSRDPRDTCVSLTIVARQKNLTPPKDRNADLCVILHFEERGDNFIQRCIARDFPVIQEKIMNGMDTSAIQMKICCVSHTPGALVLRLRPLYKDMLLNWPPMLTRDDELRHFVENVWRLIPDSSTIDGPCRVSLDFSFAQHFFYAKKYTHYDEVENIRHSRAMLLEEMNAKSVSQFLMENNVSIHTPKEYMKKRPLDRRAHVSLLLDAVLRNKSHAVEVFKSALKNTNQTYILSAMEKEKSKVVRCERCSESNLRIYPFCKKCGKEINIGKSAPTTLQDQDLKPRSGESQEALESESLYCIVPVDSPKINGLDNVMFSVSEETIINIERTGVTERPVFFYFLLDNTLKEDERLESYVLGIINSRLPGGKNLPYQYCENARHVVPEKEFETFLEKYKQGTENSVDDALHDRFVLASLQLQQIQEEKQTSVDHGEFQTPTSKLHDAVLQGDIRAVEKLVRNGVDQNIVDKYGWTALHIAVFFGLQKVCNILDMADGSKVINEIGEMSQLRGSRNLNTFDRFRSRHMDYFRSMSALDLAVVTKRRFIAMILASQTENEVLMERSMSLAKCEVVLYDLLVNRVLKLVRKKFRDKMYAPDLYFSTSEPSSRIILGFSDEITHPEEYEFCAVKVQKRNPYFVDSEAMKVANSEEVRSAPLTQEENDLIHTCIKEWSVELWKKHSNLNIISGCSIKSSKKGQDLHRNPCIVLYCSCKGMIPCDESSFPRVLPCADGRQVPVDVREGFFDFGAPQYGLTTGWNDHLCMGTSIGSYSREISGSVGPFVQLDDGKLGFITCAHVLFDCTASKFNFKASESEEEVKVVQPGNSEFTGISKDERVCGFVSQASFIPSSAALTKSDVSVDAAVVEITKRHPEMGIFAHKDRNQHGRCGFKDFPQFRDGAVMSLVKDHDRRKDVVKSGRTTGLTRGAFNLDGAQVRVKKKAIFGIEDREIFQVMQQQYEILNVGSLAFFQPGDSGSAVFTVDEEDKLKCIGIAIGSTNYSTIVTPIEPILQELQLRRGLKSFIDDDMETDNVDALAERAMELSVDDVETTSSTPQQVDS